MTEYWFIYALNSKKICRVGGLHPHQVTATGAPTPLAPLFYTTGKERNREGKRGTERERGEQRGKQRGQRVKYRNIKGKRGTEREIEGREENRGSERKIEEQRGKEGDREGTRVANLCGLIICTLNETKNGRKKFDLNKLQMN